MIWQTILQFQNDLYGICLRLRKLPRFPNLASLPRFLLEPSHCPFLWGSLRFLKRPLANTKVHRVCPFCWCGVQNQISGLVSWSRMEIGFQVEISKLVYWLATHAKSPNCYLAQINGTKYDPWHEHVSVEPISIYGRVFSFYQTLLMSRVETKQYGMCERCIFLNKSLSTNQNAVVKCSGTWKLYLRLCPDCALGTWRMVMQRSYGNSPVKDEDCRLVSVS